MRALAPSLLLLLLLGLSASSCTAIVVDVSADGEGEGEGEGESDGGGADKGDRCDPKTDKHHDDTPHCSEDLSCDPVAGGKGEYVCAEPMLLRGLVYDALSGDAVEGALVSALDATGMPITDVTTSGADGSYELRVAAPRDDEGELVGDTLLTLQVFAADYAPFPSGVRPALPVSSAAGQAESSTFVIETPVTDVALLPLPAEQRGGATIHGKVGGDLPAGALIVAEGATTPAPYGLADRSGEFTIFNVAPGAVSVVGYRAGLEVTSAAIDAAAATTHEVALDVVAVGDELGRVSGEVTIVDGGGSSLTSVVLVPTSVYDGTFERGPVPFGLRAPAPGIQPDIGGAFTIAEVPAGTYKVLAAGENDGLIRDPDESIAGTELLEVVVDEGAAVQLSESFKITAALAVISPAAEAPEAVAGAPSFTFADDSSEDRYIVTVYDALGDQLWEKTDVPKVSGSATVTVPYEGPALVPGMWYQFRAAAVRDKNDAEIWLSRTEDLRGVFFVE